MPVDKYASLRRRCLKCTNQKHATSVSGEKSDGVVGSTENHEKMIKTYFHETPYDRPSGREDGK
jgi:hypothetical protein